MKKYIAKLHYLTQDMHNITHISQAKIACESGCKWVQYRCLSKSDEDLLKDLTSIAEICDDWGTTLIVTNHWHLLGSADIQGVHIEDMDCDISPIRQQIGEDKVLGASATNIHQINQHIKNGVDYIGCGPFAHTNTKPNNHSHWGLEGYRNVIQELQINSLSTPLIAVGGVSLTDVLALMETGIHGIAAAAAINLSNDPSVAYKEFHNLIY